MFSDMVVRMVFAIKEMSILNMNEEKNTNIRAW